jgi:oxalate decarboxylase
MTIVEMLYSPVCTCLSPDEVYNPTMDASPQYGGTSGQLNVQNPYNLGAQSTDSGTVLNLKWRFSDSKTKIFDGRWSHTQVTTDLPASHDIAAA